MTLAKINVTHEFVKFFAEQSKADEIRIQKDKYAKEKGHGKGFPDRKSTTGFLENLQEVCGYQVGKFVMKEEIGQGDATSKLKRKVSEDQVKTLSEHRIFDFLYEYIIFYFDNLYSNLSQEIRHLISNNQIGSFEEFIEGGDINTEILAEIAKLEFDPDELATSDNQREIETKIEKFEKCKTDLNKGIRDINVANKKLKGYYAK